RFDARLEGLRRLSKGVFVGLSYVARAEDVRPVEPGGMLEEPGVVGAGGGLLSGAGALFRLDTRDHAFGPRSGWLVVATPRLFHQAFGSDHDYLDVRLEASVFTNPVRDHVLAFDTRV